MRGLPLRNSHDKRHDKRHNGWHDHRRNQRLIYHLDLLSVLLAKELKVRYKNSILGYLWSLLNPLTMALIFYFAFKVILRVPIENYSFFLITGLFPWQWFSNSVSSSTGILLGNASIIKKVNFPRHFIPLANVLNDLTHFLLTIPVIAGFGLFFGVYPTLWWFVGIPALILAQFLITYGLSLFVASANLFFRDLERLVGIFLMVLFYGTPIFYDLTLVPESLRAYLYLNPMTGIISCWRELFLKGSFYFSFYIIYLSYALLVFLFGLFVFRKLSPRFAEVL